MLLVTSIRKHNLNWCIWISQQDEIPDIQQEIASTIKGRPKIDAKDFVVDVSSVLLLETLCITRDLRWCCTSRLLIHVTWDNFWLASSLPLHRLIAMWRACKQANFWRNFVAAMVSRSSMLHEMIFNATKLCKIRATMLQDFESLSKTCKMLPQWNLVLNVAFNSMLH